MSGIPNRYSIELVDGIIVGGDYRRIALHDPDGNCQIIWNTTGEDTNCLARSYIDDLKKELGEEFIRLGWDKEWYIYDSSKKNDKGIPGTI
jgi:hypothetical protein